MHRCEAKHPDRAISSFESCMPGKLSKRGAEYVNFFLSVVTFDSVWVVQCKHAKACNSFGAHVSSVGMSFCAHFVLACINQNFTSLF